MVYRASPFSRLAKWTAHAVGHPFAFTAAVFLILAWAISGPIFHYSDTWQLVINTSTTIVTFLMVILLQNSQNRDNAAIQLKLDELIRSSKGAHNVLLDIEELTEQELSLIRNRYGQLARQAREDLQSGLRDTGTPEIEPNLESNTKSPH